MDELSRTVEVETDQPPYNLFNRGIEAEVLPYCREQDIGVLVYGPLSHGLLSGNFDPSTMDEDDWRRGHEPFAGDDLERNLEAVERLRAPSPSSAGTRSRSWRWRGCWPSPACTWRSRRAPPGHVEGIAPAADIELSEDELAEIDELTGAAGRAWGLDPRGLAPG